MATTLNVETSMLTLSLCALNTHRSEGEASLARSRVHGAGKEVLVGLRASSVIVKVDLAVVGHREVDVHGLRVGDNLARGIARAIASLESAEIGAIAASAEEGSDLECGRTGDESDEGNEYELGRVHGY